MSRHLAALAYIRRIKNVEKQRYARAYLSWVMTGHGEEPTTTLSYMGKQSVWMALARLDINERETSEA